MLDMGFIPDIERICKLIPFTRQTLFFSATMPPEITKLTEQFLQAPVRIEVSKPATTNASITQKLVKSGSKPWDKRDRLRQLIRAEGDELKNAIIFCNRKTEVATLFRSLVRHEFDAGALHGDMDQRSRTTMLENFRKGKLRLLVASDVAARGLDIPDVSHVFNFDVPTHSEDYVHRIGRTGRAGRSGKAFTIVTRADRKYVDGIEKLIGQDIEWLDGDLSTLTVEDEADEKPRRGGRAERGGKKRDQGKSRRAEEPVEEAVSPSEKPAPRREDRRRERKDMIRSTNEEQRGRRRERPERETETLVGFGDDIPDFMKVPGKV